MLTILQQAAPEMTLIQSDSIKKKKTEAEERHSAQGLLIKCINENQLNEQLMWLKFHISWMRDRDSASWRISTEVKKQQAQQVCVCWLIFQQILVDKLKKKKKRNH